MTREFIGFLIVGAINTVGGYVVYLFLLLVLPYQIAYTFTYVGSIIVSYLLNSRFVFQQDLTLRKFILYPLVYVVQYVVGITSLSILVDWFTISETIAPLLVIILTIPFSFTMSRYILKK